jgi:isocitrate/isopropylmalate dehydrogenase
LGTFTLEFTHLDWNSKNFDRGYYIPEGELELLRTHDAVLFGAVGFPGTFFLPERESSISETLFRALHEITPPE